MPGTDADALVTALTPYSQIHLIMAAPRTCSTLLARMLWGQPDIASYAHEPFDVVYHCAGGLDDVVDRLGRPLDLATLPGYDRPRGGDLLIKELSFQVGPYFPALAALARRPIVFTLRDPRLAVRSRMRQRERNGHDAVFPPEESGWKGLVAQIEHCREHGIPYVLVEGDAMRRSPERTAERLCAELGLPFVRTMLRWTPCPGLDLGLSLSEQNLWNDHVLSSDGVHPPTEIPPDVSWFPEAGGLRDHVGWAFAAYEELCADPRMLGAR